MENRLDIILFGASGFTGKYTVPYLYKLSKEYGKDLTWGVAGRSRQKLEATLKEAADNIGTHALDDISIIIADVTNEESIIQMTSQAKVVINCSGPYQQYGEVVVKSCIYTGTHYIDISGEVYFNELIELKYQYAAEIKGVYIVSACGFDSIASELGIALMNKKFSGTLNSVEIYISPKGKKVDNGSSTNYGTWESAVNGLAMVRNLYSLQRCKNLAPIPKFYPALWPRLPFSKGVNIGKPSKYIVPFPSPDYYVVQRTQRHFYEVEKKRPIQVKYYTLMNSWLYMLFAMFYGLIVFTMCQFRCGRNLLLKYPEFFTNGFVSKSNPSEETTKNSVLNLYFYGEGWKEKTLDPDYQFETPPNKSVLAQLTVRNPGYGFTCLSATLAAIIILVETSKLPPKGGVYTPTVAFQHTSYLEDVEKRSSALDIIEIRDLY